MLPLILFIAALAFYLPLSGHIPITDPVEANYALTAKEMLQSGDWLSPRIYGKVWFDKPALIYWLIAVSYKIFGVGEFAARLPAALFSAASVSFACWFATRLYSSALAGLFAAVVLGTSLEFWVLARMVITDAVLFFFTSVSLAAFYLSLRRDGKGWSVVACAAAGFAVLAKGPVGVVMPGIILFIYIAATRRWHLFAPLLGLRGIAAFLAIAAPWYIAMYLAHGRDFIDTFLGLHNYLRATVSEHPKDNVFYYYLILFPVSLMPWTGVFLRALAARRGVHFTYLAVWLAAFIGFYTLMATKYPTYVFPALFPACLLVARELTEMQGARPRALLWVTVPALALLAVFAAGVAWLPPAGWWPLYTVVALGAVTIGWLGFRGEAFLQPVAVGFFVVAVGLILIHRGLVPLAESRSAKTLAAALPPQGAAVASIGEYPTSAVFYSGYTIPRLTGQTAAAAAQNVWAGKHTMPVETTAAFTARAAGNPQTYLIVSRGQEPLAGFGKVADYGRLALYKKQ